MADDHYFMEKMCMDARSTTSQKEIQRAEKKKGLKRKSNAFPSLSEQRGGFDLQQYIEQREANFRNVIVKSNHGAMRLDQPRAAAAAPDEAPQIVPEQWANSDTAEWVLPIGEAEKGEQAAPATALVSRLESAAAEPGWSDCCEEGPLDFSTKSRKKAQRTQKEDSLAEEEEVPWEPTRDKRRKKGVKAQKLDNKKLLSFADDDGE
jgi:hypothetical protein